MEEGAHVARTTISPLSLFWICEKLMKQGARAVPFYDIVTTLAVDGKNKIFDPDSFVTKSDRLPYLAG